MGKLDDLFDHVEAQSSKSTLDALFDQAETGNNLPAPGHGMGDVKLAESRADGMNHGEAIPGIPGLGGENIPPLAPPKRPPNIPAYTPDDPNLAQILAPSTFNPKPTIQQPVYDENGKVKDYVPTEPSNPLAPVQDVGSLATRTLGAAVPAEFSRGTNSGGQLKTFTQAMADPESGLGRAVRDHLSNTIAERFGNMGDQDRSIWQKAIDATLMGAAVAGYGATTLLEDPTTLILGVAKTPAIFAKFSPEMKTAIAKFSGLDQAALERASKIPTKEIEAAAGTQKEQAANLLKATSPEGIDQVQAPLQAQKTAMEMAANGKTKVRIDTPSPNAIDFGKPLRDMETGKTMDYPMDVLRKAGNVSEGLTEEKKIADQAQKQFENLQSQYQGKKVIDVADAVDLKQRVQKILKGAYGQETPGYKNIMKAFGASARVAIENAVANHVSPEYVPLMRKIADNYSKFDDVKDIFSDDAFRSASKLSNIGTTTNEKALNALKNLDAMLQEGGVDSHFADDAMKAYTAKQLGVKPGEKLAGVSVLHTGKALHGMMLGSLMGSAAGPHGTGLGALLGMMMASPKGAVNSYRVLNWASQASKDSRAMGLLNAISKTRNASAVLKLSDELDKLAVPTEMPFRNVADNANAEDQYAISK
jgi:hypothetical protein